MSGVSAERGNRLVCYCDDCQSFPIFLGQAERTLDPHGGTTEPLGRGEEMALSEALASYTLHPAFVNFLDDRTGTIEAGKLADLIVLDANPLEDIRHSNTIAMVMKNGDLFDGNTLQMLWPEERPAPDTGFRFADPPGTGSEARR